MLLISAFSIISSCVLLSSQSELSQSRARFLPSWDVNISSLGMYMVEAAAADKTITAIHAITAADMNSFNLPVVAFFAINKVPFV